MQGRATSSTEDEIGIGEGKVTRWTVVIPHEIALSFDSSSAGAGGISWFF